MPHVRRTKRRPSVTRKAKIATASCLAVAVTLTFVGLSLGTREDRDAAAEAAAEYNANVTAPAAPPTETPEAEPVTEEEPAPAATDIGGILTGTNDVVISVLGDSTGNARGEWVDLWAQDLAEYGSVTVHFWDQEAEEYRPEAVTYPGEGKAITIWNGSQPGATADYPVDKMAVIQPETPDVVLYSFGHNGAATSIAPTFDVVTSAVREVAPEAATAVIVQNPAAEPRAARTTENQFLLRRWAEANSMPLLDIRAAFEEQPNLPALLLDDGTGVHPNDAGSVLWAETMASLL